ncbi:WhiB family transcriptional regulator [Brevibacterium casei]|uniref:WhiB family transcriptional regulator n=1 Tax=Brevibacterium casei TaxID=33889 RepID=UPI0039F0C7E4
MTTPRHSDRYSTDWEGALCAQLGGAGADPIFFPTGPDQAAQAVALCFDCPLRQSCLRAALEEEATLPFDQRFGIRGGLTARERLTLTPERLCPDCGVPVVNNARRCDDDRTGHTRRYDAARKQRERRDSA